MAKKNLLLEVLEKPFFKKDENPAYLSSEPEEERVDVDLDSDIPIGFFDDSSTNLYMPGGSVKQKSIKEQAQLINSYRSIAGHAEVSDAIAEIVDESIFSASQDDVLNVVFENEFPESMQEKINIELKSIMNRVKLKKNIYTMFHQFYVDGQLNIHCAYDTMDMGGGIKSLSIISPFGLNFNFTKNIWEYAEIEGQDLFSGRENQNNRSRIFNREEIIRIDSGIYKQNLILGNLHTAIKPANMLSTLEDMLIPMRFTRSVSRRVFNVDVSNLNNKKAEEVMQKNQSKFKYKKFYDLNTGTISNQQHVTSLTEDYWFPNRGGEKGTTVDTIDETGNLGELGDILYFKRKLYTSLKVPVSRLNDEGPGEGSFDYDNTSVEREEIKFFNFVTRLRNNFLELFYELVRRQIITKGYATDLEWEELLPLMKIKFTSENKFYEKMERETLSQNIDMYSSIEELTGKYFSQGFIFKKVFKMSDDEMNSMIDEIEKEKKDPRFKNFYSSNDEEEGW